MTEITSRKDLEKWLKGKPIEFAQVIAARAALRVLPYAFVDRVETKWVNDHALSVIRATAISWAARNIPAHDMVAAAYAAGSAAHASAYATVFAAFAAAFAALATARVTADAAADVAAADAAADAAAHAAADAATNAAAHVAIWDNVSADCDWLGTSSDAATDARRLTCERLWLNSSSFDWSKRWEDAAARLFALDPSYQVWIDWYNRRIKGEDAAFDIPGDTNQIEDKKILVALADATNEDFWDKGATHVNTTLQRWIDDARERVRPTIDPAAYTQNPLAIGFGANAEGEVDALPELAGDRVLRDADAQDRHRIAREEALAALAASSRDVTQAYDIGDVMGDYLGAIGDDVEAIRPSALVLVGDKLRRLRAQYLSPTSNKPPLADAQDFALENWERAHNALVGIDPFLSRIERQSYGPDVPVTVITPDAIKAVIDNAREAGVASAQAQQMLTDAVDNVPAEATPDERRYRLSVESFKNFIRGTADLVRKHGTQAVVGGYGAALWIQRNVEWLRDLFVGEQSIIDLINWIVSLPL